MLQKLTGLAAASAVAIVALGVTAASPAMARNQCFFTATNGFTFVITRSASARRMRTACRRAERRCNRELRRAKRRRLVPRGNQIPVCRRIGVASG